MLTDNQKHIIAESIKQLTKLSDSGKDIIDIIEELSKQSFDYNMAQARISYIYGKYNDLYLKVNSLPTTVKKEAYQITELDLRYVLQAQLDFLLQKEWEAHYNEQNEI